MVKWQYASEEARKGSWQRYAADRCRFHKRVLEVSHVLNKVLDKEHRERIWGERFCSDDMNNIIVSTKVKIR
nr:unnamed protein product [Callosobruchus analis]